MQPPKPTSIDDLGIDAWLDSTASEHNGIGSIEYRRIYGEYKRGEISIYGIAKRLGLKSRNTVYDYNRRIEAEGDKK